MALHSNARRVAVAVAVAGALLWLAASPVPALGAAPEPAVLAAPREAGRVHALASLGGAIGGIGGYEGYGVGFLARAGGELTLFHAGGTRHALVLAAEGGRFSTWAIDTPFLFRGVQLDLGSLRASWRVYPWRGSSFDRYMAGDEAALSQAAKRGLVALVESGCTRCHSGPMFSDFKLHRLGLPTPPGRMPDVGDGTGRFRTSSLRNVTRTGPFMHDGRFKTLQQVLKFYTEVDKSLDPDLADLAPAGLDDITALFEALSDGDFDRTIPAHVPSGLPPGGYLD